LVKKKVKKKSNSLNIFNQLVSDICEQVDLPSGLDIPFPKNSSMRDGSKKVKIGGSKVGLKDIFNKSEGDEPSTLETLSKIFTRKRSSARKKK